MKRLISLTVTLTLIIISKPCLASGDPIAGAKIFETCSACHGEQGAGNKALQVPKIAGRSELQLVKKIQDYQRPSKSNKRVKATRAQMEEIAQSLPDQQAIEDVAAYITRL